MMRTAHAPSKLATLPPPPSPPEPLFRDARREVSESSLLGRSGSTDRGALREPETDLSSLPMLPPALPDCALASRWPKAIDRQAAKTTIIRCRNAVFMSKTLFQSDQSKHQERPEPSAQTAPIMRQVLPALLHCSIAAFFASSTLFRATSDQDLSEIANAPQRLP